MERVKEGRQKGASNRGSGDGMQVKGRPRVEVEAAVQRVVRIPSVKCVCASKSPKRKDKQSRWSVPRNKEAFSESESLEADKAVTHLLCLRARRKSQPESIRRTVGQSVGQEACEVRVQQFVSVGLHSNATHF